MAANSSAPYSTSVQGAIDWANAVARVRANAGPAGGSPETNARDLFVGALLAHADANGEVQVILDHFGLTARDVVGEDYARLSPSTLAAVLPYVSVGAAPSDEIEINEIFEMAGMLSPRGPIQLLHLLGGMLSAPTQLAVALDHAFETIGEDQRAISVSYNDWLSGAPQQKEVAGESLRTWLREHNPRSPVGIAGFATDDVAGPVVEQQDLVGISPESNALAYLVAARDLVPPLAIGLFGDWGSGKSFLMRDVQRRIDRLVELSRDQPQNESAVWKNIEHISFNAWEYVQGDLWAALLEKVFRTLDTRVVEASLVSERKAPIRVELERQEAILVVARLQEDTLSGLVHTLEGKAQKAKNELEERETEAKQNAASPDEAVRVVKEALAEQWEESRIEGLDPELEDLADALADAWDELRSGPALFSPYWRRWTHVALISAVLLIVPLGTWALQTFTEIPEVNALLATVAVSIPALAGWLRSATKWISKQRRHIEDAQSKIETMRQKPVDDAEEALADAQARLAIAKADLEKQKANVSAEQGRAMDLASQLNAITPGKVFVEFAGERSTDYRSKLGLLGAVREDLRQLEREIVSNNTAAIDSAMGYDASVPNRIVLYIDDLDRCPPAKVVQVLEAVHLLLAFPLFVVFVAVDSRWLSSALIEELHALRTLSQGKADTPTARDYIEKIFQLPFWVQPLSGEERGAIVSGLLSPAIRSAGEGTAPGGGVLRLDDVRTSAIDRMIGQSGSGLRVETSSLTLSPEEVEFAAHLGPLLGDTPRRVKRFVNTLQFLLSVRPPLGEVGAHAPRQALALFAAINDGLPNVARHVFRPENVTRALGDILSDPEIPADERVRLNDWLAVPGHSVWSDVAAVEIGERAEMVQRLGFLRPLI
ncbi:P-loop NTPase fold protein [Leifsonia flava]|uniref:KAP NTPase domain-containing protein n=1 Tax=Orlajensenia leifsoniae TaxID=2561933 RepID=A0A4Y9QQJ2_9MICO|nr:P-loop NTPase fold protein [Leifsonia flava]TFV94869.1 hypothetical protein E4M00_17090 [Leifsonia flava]